MKDLTENIVCRFITAIMIFVNALLIYNIVRIMIGGLTFLHQVVLGTSATLLFFLGLHYAIKLICPEWFLNIKIGLASKKFLALVVMLASGSTIIPLSQIGNYYLKESKEFGQTSGLLLTISYMVAVFIWNAGIMATKRSSEAPSIDEKDTKPDSPVEKK